MASLRALHELDRRAIAANIRHHDFFRRSGGRRHEARGDREWLHFFVAAPSVDLFVNLSIFDDLRPAAQNAERARVLVLTRQNGVWDGDGDEIASADLQARGGQVAARFGMTEIDFVNGVFRLRGVLRERPIAFDLVLEPRAFPSLTTDTAIAGGGTLHWLVVPQLVAGGTVTIGNATHSVNDAPAYHDHNWGTFTQRDFRWQWGHAQDLASGRSIVLARLLDGVAGSASLQVLFVWEGPRLVRIFRAGDLTFLPKGFLRRSCLTLPRFASLVASGATEVPARIAMEARSGDDFLGGEMALEDAACLALSDDAELESTLLYEALGRLSLNGQIAGKDFAIDAPVVFETMRKA